MADTYHYEVIIKVRANLDSTMVTRLVKLLDRYGRFLDALAHTQLSERCPCVGQGAMQDLLDFTDALSVQALLSLHRTKIHERVTEELFLLRRHRPSIQCPGIPPLR